MDHSVNVEKVLYEQFGPGQPVLIATAPGRVNLIGEHTDYNDGYVLPMAIDYGMTIAGRLQNGASVKVHSVDYNRTVTFSLREPLEYDRENPWSNYLRGVCWAMQERGINLPGMELVFGGDIPQGAGLSSSAALEVAAAFIFQRLSGFDLGRLETAQLCQRAENEFVGMKCGIMDQCASVMGKAGHALFLDCRFLDLQQIPLDLGDYRILVCHSGVKHELVASEYNRRRQSCLEGVAVLQRHFPEIRALRDANLDMLEEVRSEMSAEVARRCYHVITENQRVLDSIGALSQGDLAGFGGLMNQSHDSLRDDYEVSCAEVDLLVELARKIPGVLGARITGGGFGGCTVNLLAAEAVERFEREVRQAYLAQTGINPASFVCTPAEGAKIK
ncbi:MAG TPA: galactokinase [Bacillota bacterium]|nr:galactokinase [Bacillota bacterium]